MTLNRFTLPMLVAAMLLGPAAMAADQPDSAALWADFNHYVHVARPDLADAAGTALLTKIDKQALLDVVEASDYKDYDQALQRATRIAVLKETAGTLTQWIQSARIERSREPKRILDDIQRLALGKRANHNATQRLKAAGQYAAPYLLATLLDENQQKLHSLVLSAMVAVGRPMVYPLSVAMPQLEPVPLGQVATVLNEIGYPEPLPYLKQVQEDNRVNPMTLSIVQSAHDQLVKASTATPYMNAAELYFELGKRQYLAGSKGVKLPGYDEAMNNGLVWEYDREAGLVAVAVPGAVYSDVLAMRSSQQALRLDPRKDAALSLWLMANLRRENRMPKGVRDKSYPSTMQPPAFYLEMAGPLRQHDVLDRALNDRDVDLALDAISALATTAGTEALINREGTVQPLLRALAYPDRRVRFNAAFAMTNTQPRFSFPGSELVVPVLAEAVRQSATRHAMVLTPDPETLNRLIATVTELGYQPIGALSIDEVSTQVNTNPGVDLIVVQGNAIGVESVYRQTAIDYRLAAVPMLALVQPVEKNELIQRINDKQRLFFALPSSDTPTLKAAFEEASQANFGAVIDADESFRFAITSLTLLRATATSNNAIFNVSDALPTLTRALYDPRTEVAVRAGSVLSLINDARAQQAITDAALHVTRPTASRVALLESLSESARFYGNHLSDLSLGKLRELVKTSRGDLVTAGAQAHGALTLPTSDVVQQIIE